MKIYLDLLPKDRKIEIKRKKRFRRILRGEMLFLFPLILLVAILLNIYYLISVKQTSLIVAHSLTKSQDKYQELSLYEEKFKQVNDNSALLLKIQAGHLYWGKIFEKISILTPDGIAITDFSTKNYKVFLIGNAKSRDVLLNYKQSLEADGCFSDMNVPLSNLVVKENVDFQIDFSIMKDCIKKQ